MRHPQIDFDAASTAWMATKIRRGPMLYYRCEAARHDGTPCPNAVLHPDPTAPHLLCGGHSRRRQSPSSTSTPSNSAKHPARA